MAKLSYLLIIVIFSAVCGLQVKLDEEWAQYKERFNKTYNSDCQEKTKRKNWEKNLEFILRHNLQADMGVHNFTVGLNEFSDMSSEEFIQVMTGCLKYNVNDTMLDAEIYSPPLDTEVNDTVDYRKQGMVTEVQNQGGCGSCYAFCSCACLEAMNKKYNGQLIALSEQNIVDCSVDFGNFGCNGGFPQRAFAYVYSNRGLDTLKSYPYEEQEGRCRFNPGNAVPSACKHTMIMAKGDERGMLLAVGSIGPIAVAMNADTAALHHYKTGVFSDPTCHLAPVNHCVTIIGYGVENGQEYWLIKNSWGTSWGNKGYFKIVRNRNMCLIAEMPVFCK